MNARVTLNSIAQAIDGLRAIHRELEVLEQPEVESLGVDANRAKSCGWDWPAPWFLRDSDSYGNDKD